MANWTKDKVFMSHMGKRIWYTKDENGNVLYMVARGDGTDETFTDWKDAFEWIKKGKESQKNEKRKAVRRRSA